MQNKHALREDRIDVLKIVAIFLGVNKQKKN